MGSMTTVNSNIIIEADSRPNIPFPFASNPMQKFLYVLQVLSMPNFLVIPNPNPAPIPNSFILQSLVHIPSISFLLTSTQFQIQIPRLVWRPVAERGIYDIVTWWGSPSSTVRTSFERVDGPIRCAESDGIVRFVVGEEFREIWRERWCID